MCMCIYIYTRTYIRIYIYIYDYIYNIYIATNLSMKVLSREQLNHNPLPNSPTVWSKLQFFLLLFFHQELLSSLFQNTIQISSSTLAISSSRMHVVQLPSPKVLRVEKTSMSPGKIHGIPFLDHRKN